MGQKQQESGGRTIGLKVGVSGEHHRGIPWEITPRSKIKCLDIDSAGTQSVTSVSCGQLDLLPPAEVRRRKGH